MLIFPVLIFKNKVLIRKERTMSGLVQWSSKAKRKAGKKAAGAKPNARRQRLLAARKRKLRASAEKAAKKASK